MIKASIIGATGYTGAELVRILARHPEVELVALTSQSYVGQEISQVFPHLKPLTTLLCSEQDVPKVARESDVIFTALPHGLSVPIVQEAIANGAKVIDLGADFRLDDIAEYQHWYKVEHLAPGLLAEAVYGLPEINREKIASARVVGNPGCYPTSVVLGLAPLLKTGLVKHDSIIIDAKSGVSGAGRGLSLGIHYSECNDSIKAYNVGGHRHIPEIEQELTKLAGAKVSISFTPHLVPMTRGMLSTIYGSLTKGVTAQEVQQLYTSFYAAEPFVQVLPLGELPQTKWCSGSNYCFIGLVVDPRVNRVVVLSALDNLVKGASGQAVQNMNLMFGLPETCGLEFAGLYP
ncbi:MAG: N-acetyl-gamma-glutamyl-phosphate reductase [Carboxydocellales bacterium]